MLSSDKAIKSMRSFFNVQGFLRENSQLRFYLVANERTLTYFKLNFTLLLMKKKNKEDIIYGIWQGTLIKRSRESVR